MSRAQLCGGRVARVTVEIMLTSPPTLNLAEPRIVSDVCDEMVCAAMQKLKADAEAEGFRLTAMRVSGVAY